MPPRRISDDFESDSDVSVFDDIDDGGRGKGKGKGKAIDRRKKDKGKGKAKEVRNSCSLQSQLYSDLPIQQQPYAWEASYTRSWDTVQEDEAGSLQGAVEDLIARGRRKRYVYLFVLRVHFLIQTSQTARASKCNTPNYYSTPRYYT